MRTCYKNWRLFATVAILLTTSQVGAGQEKKKPAYAILIDSTGSMRSQFVTVFQLGREIAHQVHDRGPVSIFCFKRAPDRRDARAMVTAVVEQTQDERLLDKAFDEIYIQAGQTTLFDAIDLMADGLNKQASDSPKVIVMITDGEDRASKASAAQVIEKLKSLNIPVYVIGLVQELEPKQRQKATDLLRRISLETGGQAVIVEPGVVNVQRVIRELALP